ncbi:MAG: hypothetical protein WBL63_14680 [Candidatus Acidiferrum sp.]
MTKFRNFLSIILAFLAGLALLLSFPSPASGQDILFKLKTRVNRWTLWYSDPFAGGFKCHTFHTSGQFPPGLSLSTDTVQCWVYVISGYPTVPGKYFFNVTADECTSSCANHHEMIVTDLAVTSLEVTQAIQVLQTPSQFTAGLLSTPVAPLQLGDLPVSLVEASLAC